MRRGDVDLDALIAELGAVDLNELWSDNIIKL
jgi:hypothetical protein